MPFVTNFLPSTSGFSFGNSFPPQPDKLIPTPFGDIAIGNASNGLCGGMAFAVRDYFEAGIVQPSGSQPALGHPLYDFIVDRLFTSFDLPFGVGKYYDWMCTADHDTWFKTGVGRRTIVDEWPQIKADIDANRLSCLGLVTVFSLNPGDLGKNHQVLAHGYELDNNGGLQLFIYDPNSPLDDGVRISLNLGNPGGVTGINHNVRIRNPVRGFFRVPYVAVRPPSVDDAEIVTFVAPLAMAAGSTSPVSLWVKNTGTTTWEPSGANPYRLGSQRPQDNDNWGLTRVGLAAPLQPKQVVNFAFNVTAPARAGINTVQMGWRMVCESRQWFGELEFRSITVTGQTPPANPCQQLRDEIIGAQDEVAEYQAELHTAVGQAKAFLVSQIRRKKAEIEKLRQEANGMACPNVP
jgi:hypothetical protein